MTDSAFRGPLSNMGSMEDSPTTIQPEDGPLYTYQGVVISNLRGGAFQKDGNGNARVPAFLTNPQIVTVDNIPSASSTTAIAIAAAVTTGTAMTLTTVAPGNTTAGVPSVATGVPFIPFGSSTPITVAIALDFGFTTGTTTAGNSTIVVVDNTLFTVGQWISVGGGANAAKTATLLTQVQSIVSTNTTGITVSPSPSGSLTNAPIGAANLWNQFLPPATQFGPGTPAPTAEAISLAAGLFRIFNPLQSISRNVSITGSIATAAGGNFLVSGYDVFNAPMTELVTKAAGTAASFGKKAFKYIASVVPQFADATTVTYSIGIGDVIGFPIRADRQEYVDWSYGGIFKANSTGFTAPFIGTSLNTTADVRGTLQIGPNGAGTAINNGAAANGVNRFFIVQTLPLWNTITATPNNTAPFFGVTQA